MSRQWLNVTCAALLLMALLSALAGCGMGRLPPIRPPGVRPGRAPSPEEAVQRSMMGQDEQQNRRLIGQRDLAGDVLVVYFFTQPATLTLPASEMFEYGVAVRQRAGWGMRAGGGGNILDVPPGARVRYVLADIGGPNQPQTIVAGEALQAEVAAVEVRLTTGEVLSDAGAAFVLVAPQPDVAMCELSLLDADGEVLEQIPLERAPVGEC